MRPTLCRHDYDRFYDRYPDLSGALLARERFRSFGVVDYDLGPRLRLQSESRRWDCGTARRWASADPPPEPAGFVPDVFPQKEVIPCLVRVFCATWHGQAVAASASESNEPIVICSPSRLAVFRAGLRQN